MLTLYSVVLTALVPLILIRYFVRARKNPAYAKRIGERFGLINSAPKMGGVWVHAVSVGESIAAIKLIKRIQKTYPDIQLTVTCGTPTGSEIIQNQLGDAVFHTYIPLDLPRSVKRFLAACQPSLGIIMETELWPNLFHYAHQNGVKLVVSNMRLSQTSYQRYKKWPKLTALTLSKVHRFAVQTNVDAERVIALGAENAKVKIVGNLKFEMDDSNSLPLYSKQKMFKNRQCWLAGSTHDGEDAPIIRTHLSLIKLDPSLLLILVPRHPERFDEVYGLCQAHCETVRRSQLETLPVIPPGTQILLLDTMGELNQFIKVADFSFIGGSLVPVGGHNIIEACQAGVPVIYGPYMKNFLQVAKIVQEEGAGLQVQNEAGLLEAASSLLLDKSRREKMANKGEALIEKNQGALNATMRLIDSIVAKI